MQSNTVTMTAWERRERGPINRSLSPHPSLGLSQVARSAWKCVTGVANGAQNLEEEEGREKRWDAQSSVLLATSPLVICSPPHLKHQQKNKRHISVYILSDTPPTNP